MDEKSSGRAVTPFRLTPAIAEKRIRSLAAASGNIDWSFHALDRMVEREIFDVDVLRVMRMGSVAGEPEPARTGEWKCKLIRQIRGARSVGVVLILKPGRLLVKTVEWEDLS